MKLLTVFVVVAVLSAQQKPSNENGVTSLSQIRRIYVGPLVGGVKADALREMIIASIDSQQLFTITENPERADAILKGAADDNTFIDTFDTSESVSERINPGAKTTSATSKANGSFSGISNNESHHIKERKDEAYATVRLCNRDGDVLWSTTQESRGAKFHGASADVAAKIARQLALDVQRATRGVPAGKNP